VGRIVAAGLAIGDTNADAAAVDPADGTPRMDRESIGAAR